MAKSQTIVSLDPIDRQNARSNGVISRLLKTRRHRGKPTKKTDAYGHYIFCGKQRSGKTVSMLWYLEYLTKKYTKSKKNPKEIFHYSNLDIGTKVTKYNISNLIRQIEYDPNVVQEKSGLNQWNAGGRNRDYDEVYIPIPAWIHKKFKGFFPERDKAFNLRLPGKEIISAKVCQDGNKALMSNPNKKLGEWLLRKVLNLKKGELLTYKKLLDVGVDSVLITKNSTTEFEIDFKKVGTYSDFKNQYYL